MKAKQEIGRRGLSKKSGVHLMLDAVWEKGTPKPVGAYFIKTLEVF